MRDTPSSDELIRRAKEDFAPTVYSRGYTVVSRSEDVEAMIAATMDTEAMAAAIAAVEMDAEPMMDPGVAPNVRMSERHRQMPVDAPPVRVPSRSSTETAYPSGPIVTTGGTGSSFLRGIGLFVLVVVAGFWALLLIATVQDPDGAGSAIGGGVVLTAIPLAFGLLLVRKSRKPKDPQGLIS